MPDDTRTYGDKRSFDRTPEPASSAPGNVDPGAAEPGKTFVVHQHHARRLHHDLRLEMMNGRTPVLVSWAVPKGLPVRKGKPHLAIHVEDHPFDYASFEGTIPAGNYGAGEVRIFDSGEYEVLEQEPGKLTFRLHGERLQGVWHVTKAARSEGKDEWFAVLRRDERPEPEPLPDLVPMSATLASEAFDDDGWIFEWKWDGVRALAVCSVDETALLSRNGRDISATYPELDKLHTQTVAIDAIVDGEIVALEKGRPSFERLQSRINLQNERDITRAMKDIPVSYVAFDLLYLDGRSLIARPLEERKELLDTLLVQTETVQVSPFEKGVGTTMFEAAKSARLEGIVAKKLGSPYRPGRRSKEWIKVKTVHDADVVVGGWSRGEGTRSQTFGALLVGAYRDDELVFLGAVGTGYTDKDCRDLAARLEELETEECPFAGGPGALRSGSWGKSLRSTRWVRPELVARVEFRELTSAGKLRAPSFKGLRGDKPPEECRWDDLLAGANA